MDIRFRLRRMKWAIKLLHCGTSVKFWKSVVIHSPTCVSIGNNTGIGDFVVIWGAGVYILEIMYLLLLIVS